ncbi:phycobiliprotein lyase [Leptothermofonsia sichuanensis E412]|uniref:phycobiliprotein lyase n=1 Tax=Leptothermofonsia sichuanensis TaxID=2917832 RepID=UPI001CA7583E|nr:phycobiliprotein lyase [Leptothermofonsia sichuanensis]QZZ23240.1 phycobiliprotein lyase [Leptothermofonsia sichuanensis E412]
MDAMEFFRRSAGRWRSQRTTHHLAFKQAEGGNSEIQVEALVADHPEIIALCEFHQINPGLAAGGCRVSWGGSMGWDQEGENHEGNTMFALVPDEGNPRQGRLLRDRGYAEIMPVVGFYHMDDDGGLNLTTEYETMSSVERFWFASPDLRLRSSTVKRFGGFSTASFCTETRIGTGADDTSGVSWEEGGAIAQVQTVVQPGRRAAQSYLSLLGW